MQKIEESKQNFSLNRQMLAIPCVIFAGGKSSRMGEDKALLPFANSPTLTQYQYNRLSKIFSHVYISCTDSKKFSFDAHFIYDSPQKNTYAPTEGFIAIFETLKENSFFAISVDSPFITEDTIQKLYKYDCNHYDATIAKTNEGIQPLCGIYHRTLEAKLIEMQAQNNHKLGYLLKSSSTNYIHFHDELQFLNLNTQDDYKKALTLV